MQSKISLPVGGGFVAVSVVSDGTSVGSEITWSQRSPVKDVPQLSEKKTCYSSVKQTVIFVAGWHFQDV